MKSRNTKNNEICAIHEDYLDFMHRDLCRSSQIEFSYSYEDFWTDESAFRYRPYNVVDGILHIGVEGALVKSFPYKLSNMLTGYEYIKQSIIRANNDPEVKGIALLIDSPGGHASECFELTEFMYKNKNKPIQSFVSNACYSAAYALAAASDKVNASKMSGLGSIGVILQHMSYEEALKKDGIEVTLIRAGKRKAEANPMEALTKEAKTSLQNKVNRTYEIFVTHVAENRGVSKESVYGTEGQTYNSEEALSLGLVDEIGQIDDSLAAFAAQLSNSNQGEKEMDDNNIPANSGTLDHAAIESARQQAVDEAVALEKQRVSSILALEEAKDNIDTAVTLIDSGLDAEKAKAILSTLPKKEEKSKVYDFDAAMSSNNPEIGPGDGESNHQEEDVVSSILSSMGISKNK